MKHWQEREARRLATDRRADPDRRRPHLFCDWRYALRGRRRGVRRAGDAVVAGVDWYHPRLMVLVIAISVLNALDAAFTLLLVQSGAGEEWNPLMRVLLQDDVQLFVNLKIAITSSALLFLVVCSNMVVLNGFKVERFLHWLLGVYLALTCYHIVLLRLAGVA
jgi:hypothetical protein